MDPHQESEAMLYPGNYNTMTEESAHSGQGGNSKRAVYEPDGAQRCKQVICSRNWAVAIVVIFCFLILTVAVIAAFARPNKDLSCLESATAPPAPSVEPTEAIATNGELFPWTDIRLPRTVLPQSYDLTIHPNLSSFHFSGHVRIEVHVKEATPFIVFHAKDLNITTYKCFHFQSTKSVAVSRLLHYPHHEQYYLEFERRLQDRSKYILQLTFVGQLSENMMGFYRSSYTTASGELRNIAVTQFEATDARAAFPCFDEPEMKARFSLTLIREARHIGLFNMPKVNTEDLGGGLLQDKFETSVVMSTYLVAFIVCDFPKISNSTSRGITVSVYAPDDQLNQATFALEAAITVLEYYEQFFGLTYPLPKLDLIAIPDFAAGAMENWGLITYRMSTLLYDPQVSTAEDQKRVAVVIAHELAHQWFGNLVTMKWWNDLWLNEGFASFVEYIGANRVKPEWRMMDQFVGSDLVTALYRDSLSNSHPVSVDVRDPAEISQLFDDISYQKGASIIRMLEGMIGRESLQQGLKNYLQKYQMGNAETDDLWDTLTESAQGVDVEAVMDTWTRQMGYPVVMVSPRDNNMVAQQAHFLLNPKGIVDTSSPFGYQWQIPLTYMTDITPESSQLILMTEVSHTFSVPENAKWLKMNVNFTGYYRVHYNQNNWLALALQLKENHSVFSSADRAELLDDAFAVSRSALLPVCTALDLAEYLHQELDFIPWTVTISNFHYVASLLEGTAAYQDFQVRMAGSVTVASLLEGKAAFQDFQYYVNSLISEVLAQLGWEPIEDYLASELRSELLQMAVHFDHNPTVEQLQVKFRDWMENNETVSQDMKNAIYHAGVKYGGHKEWEYMWKQYQTTRVPSEKHHLLTALAATTDIHRVSRYLQMSLEADKIRAQDSLYVINSIARTSPGLELAWSFVKQNWEELTRRYDNGGSEFSALIDGLLPGFRSQYYYDDVNQFLDSHPTKTGQRMIAQSKELIEMNIGWLERNLDDVTKCLQSFVHRKQRGTEELEAVTEST